MSEARAVYKEGFAHFVAGRHAEAIERYRAAIELDPKLPIAWNGLAMALEKTGDLDAAIEAAKELIALDPDDALAHTALSRLYQQKGMIPEAEDEQAIAMRLSAGG